MDDDDGSYDENHDTDVQERFIIQFEVTVQLISKISFSPGQGVYFIFIFPGNQKLTLSTAEWLLWQKSKFYFLAKRSSFH